MEACPGRDLHTHINEGHTHASTHLCSADRKRQHVCVLAYKGEVSGLTAP